MDWAFCSVNGLGLNLWKFERRKIEKLSFGFREKKKGKTVKRLVNLEENE